MNTKFKTFYTNGDTIICLHSHYKWEDGFKFYQYSWINKLTGITYEDFLREDIVDEFFSDNFVLLEDYVVSLSSNS